MLLLDPNFTHKTLKKLFRKWIRTLMECRPFPQRPLAQAIFQPAPRRLLGFPLSLALGACSRKPSRSACVGCRRRRRSARVSPLWMTSTVAQRVPFHSSTREGHKTAKPPSIFLSIFTVSQLYVVSHIVSNFPVIHLFLKLSIYLYISWGGWLISCFFCTRCPCFTSMSS